MKVLLDIKSNAISNKNPFDYSPCLRKIPKQNRSKDCVSNIFTSGLLLLDEYSSYQLTVDAVACKSGHSGSTVSEWVNLNDKKLFVECAARHYFYGLLSRIKIAAVSVGESCGVEHYLDHILEFCMPSKSYDHIILYHAWKNLGDEARTDFLRQINLQARRIHAENRCANNLADAASCSIYIVSAIWGICRTFTKSVLSDRQTLESRNQVALLVKEMTIAGIKTPYSQK